MCITSENHWSRRAFPAEVRDIAAVMLSDMHTQDPDSPTYGYYDPKSQVSILVDAAMNSWQPPVAPNIAERAGQLALMVRISELSPAGH